MILKANNISIKYDKHGRTIIDDQSLQIQQGKINIILGPNGCGKSTLFKTFAKQLKPFKGTITINDLTINNFSNKEFSKKLGILFQEHGNSLDLTTRDVLNISRYAYLNLFDQLSQNDEQKIEKAMKLTNTKRFQDIQIRNLSSGQRQLVWIAMLIAQDSDYMFFDQPTTFLDLQNQFEVMNVLEKINKQLKKTIIVIIHDVNIAAQYADIIFLMKDGKIIDRGSPDKILNQNILKQIFNVNVKIIRDNEKIMICPCK